MTLVENVRIVHEQDACVVTLRGEIDELAVPDIRTEAMAQLAGCPDDAGRVVVDVSGVTFLDSSGIGLLVELHVAAEQRGAEFVLQGTTARIAQLLKITGLDETFGVSG